MTSDDDDTIWQDDCFKFIRVCVGTIVEYAPLITEKNSPAGWMLADLRSTSHDLLQAIEDSDESSAESLIVEAGGLVIDLLRLCGKER